MSTVQIESGMWSKVSEYYFDNVHWEPNGSTLDNWIKETYNGTVSFDDRKIHFSSKAKRDWFILRWL